MRDVKKVWRNAIEAVAKEFSATCEQGSDPPGAYVVVAGKRVAVDVTTLTRSGAGRGRAAWPRLRFDKVATRLVARVQATAGGTVPDRRLIARCHGGNRPPTDWNRREN